MRTFRVAALRQERGGERTRDVAAGMAARASCWRIEYDVSDGGRKYIYTLNRNVLTMRLLIDRNKRLQDAGVGLVRTEGKRERESKGSNFARGPVSDTGPPEETVTDWRGP